MPYSFITASSNLRKVSIALLLCIQLLCAVFASFSAETAAGTADVHHSGYTLSPLVDNAQFSADTHQHGCDHCSHCHASHMGLFKAAVSLAVEPDIQPDYYLSHIALSAQSGIYRPPIA